MPVTRTAKRALRRSVRKQSVNLKRKNLIRASLKKARVSPSAASVKDTLSMLDKSVKWGLFHANKVARLKSRLVRHAAK